MLRDRVKTAVIAIAILVPPLLWGGVAGVTLLVAIFGGVAVWELTRSLTTIKSSPAVQLTVLIFLGVVAAFHLFSIYGVVAAVVLLPLFVLLLHLFLFDTLKQTVESSAQMIFVCVYVGVPLAHAILLRRLDDGVSLVFLVLVVISLGDAGAYFAGKYYGKHRFSKRISPGKTVEGLAGSLAGCLAGMLIMKLIAPNLPTLDVLLRLTVLLAIVGPLGDLAASAIKRKLDIKDYGSIMPGHGGVLDRADALIPAFPTTYYFLILSGIAVPL
ncbi:MAG: phosphatidate cytidylyltransferase [Desulfomonilaceae bacterium]|nr:phosphatidate cytidylyltransferase [Desulfomonilaceae bacterium]